jgi:hypothetical protein
MRISLIVLFLAALVSAGCGDYESGGRSAAPEAVGVVVDPFSMGEPVKRQQPAAAKEPASQAQPAPQSQRHKIPDPPPAVVGDGREPVPEGMVREEADSGAGKKGQYSPGIITTPLATYWRVQERVAYEAQVKYPLKLYRAANGSYPKTKEEFKREILKPNNVKLPELPEGHRYIYDPEKGELLIERPG